MNNTSALQELRRLMKPVGSSNKLQMTVSQAFDLMMNHCRQAARQGKSQIRQCPVEFDGVDETDPLSLEIICEELVKKCQKEQLKATYARNIPGRIWIEWS